MTDRTEGDLRGMTQEELHRLRSVLLAVSLRGIPDEMLLRSVAGASKHKAVTEWLTNRADEVEAEWRRQVALLTHAELQLAGGHIPKVAATDEGDWLAWCDCDAGWEVGGLPDEAAAIAAFYRHAGVAL